VVGLDGKLEGTENDLPFKYPEMILI
jgi:hypothetical protein